MSNFVSRGIERLFAFVDRLFNKHKLIRRLLLLWVCWLITHIITSYNDIPHQVAVAAIGLLATVIMFYQWSRDKDKDNSQ